MSSASAAAPAAEAVAAALTASDRFLVQQTFRPLLNEYRISVPAPGSAVEGEPLLFVRQKRLKVKEDIRFRLAEDDGPHLFAIASKTVFEFRGRHEVLDASGAVIGTLEKRFGRSLLRSHWRVRDAAGTEVLEALEASRLIALVRRVLDLVPEVVGLQRCCRSTSCSGGARTRPAATAASSGGCATATCSTCERHPLTSTGGWSSPSPSHSTRCRTGRRGAMTSTTASRRGNAAPDAQEIP